MTYQDHRPLGQEALESLAPSEPASGVEIAIVGMAGRFPGADSIDALWQNIVHGRESLRSFDDAELRARGVSDAALADPAYVKAGMVLDGLDRFDAGFFGYAPREAERLDPQQRVLLETAWHALEHAGYAGASTPAATAVYAGCGSNLYLLRHLLPGVDWAHSDIASLLGLMNGNDQGSLATRIAYKLDLRGPAVSVQSACSTSLVAVHMACRALLNYESDLALAGGVWLNLLQELGYRHQAGAILSPDGHCRAFDAAAAGTVIGSGAGMVVLKRLDDALRDGDTIHAVIKGSAINNDGAAKMAYSAPSVDGQAEVIEAALAMAGCDAASIAYVEAHGTGTALGDPVEIAALTQAFSATTQARGFCAIGSVKTNIGHLDAAAGVAGLIKAVLALKHRTLPPSLHFERANAQIDFAASPFYVNAEARPWDANGKPRRAGVSSFGMGGTNAHVVLEQAPAPAIVAGTSQPQTLLLSARSDEALQAAQAQLAGHLLQHPDQSLHDIAFTLHAGRRHFSHRLAVVSASHAAAAAVLTDSGSTQAVLLRGQATAAAASIAFLFPGQGAQHVGMAAELYREDGVVRDTIDRCCQLLQQHLDLDLRELLYPAAEREQWAAEQLAQTSYTQPALFVVEYALAQMWLNHGVRPDALLGHSIGEYVAACLAGVFTLEDALALVAARGRLMQSTAPGAMLAVSLGCAELQQLLQLLQTADAGCDIAAVNGEALCVVAGSVDAVETVEALLVQRTIASRRLQVNRAFHSALLEPVLAQFGQVLHGVTLRAPSIPIVSNVSGDWLTAEQACSPGYWVQHMRAAVLFADGLTLLAQHEPPQQRILLEVGPGDTLATLARRHAAAARCTVVATQLHPARRTASVPQHRQAAAQLWLAGVELGAAALELDAGRRLPLPGYPFQRQTYWIEAAPAAELRTDVGTSAPGRQDWLLRPAWQRAMPLPWPLQQGVADAAGTVLMLCDDASFAGALATVLTGQGRRLVQVERGNGFERIGAGRYAARPDSTPDLVQVLQALELPAAEALEVCHLWTLCQGDSHGEGEGASLDSGFYSLLALARALDSTLPQGGTAGITVLTRGLEDISGDEPLDALQATLQGPCKVIAQEYPQLSCHLRDLLVPTAGGEQERRLADQVAAELLTGERPALLAYRGPHHWYKEYQPYRQPASPSSSPAGTLQRLRTGGVYLITGGAGGVGMALARHLARAWQARLVLVGRSALADDAAPLRQLRALGAQVMALQADVGDAAQLASAMAAARQRFGAVNGVIHAAGVAGGGLVATRTREASQQVLAPKLQGTINLLEAVRHDAPDFVLLCSSLTAVTGGLGQTDYCAANAFLDALAHQENRRCGSWVVSVNWDVWRDTGMAAGQHLPEGEGITEDDAGVLLEQILSGPAVAQVLVSTIGLARQMARASSMALAERLVAAPAALPGANTTGARQLHPRPALADAYLAPASALESALAQLWSEFLGIAPVGVNDSLFALGGDSLMAIQLLAQVRSAYGVELHPAGLFKHPTVAALALMVETRLIQDIAGANPSALAQER